LTGFSSKVKQALIYPAFAVLTVTVALLFWLVYVLPKLAELFKGLNVQLPTITIVVMNISEFVKEYILYISASLVLISVIIFVY